MIEIAIDARMIRSSGIGTIIANVVPRLIHNNPHWRFRLLGDPAILLDYSWTEHTTITPYIAPIYSIREQLEFPTLATKGSSLLWSPNYNLPLRWSGPLLVNVNDLAHLVLPEMRRSLAKQAFAKCMFAILRRRTDSIVYISQFSADEFHRLVGKPRGQENTIHCGVDDAWFNIPRGPDTLRARPYILFVGNVKPHKNLSRLLDAYESIQNDIPHDLLIVGRKEGFITGDDAVLGRIEAFHGRVAFTGYVSDPALKQIFAQADGLVLPSLYEGFGLPPVEAMAAGCPTLVSRTASLPEVCQDASLYCDPLDVTDIAAGLKQLVGDETIRKTLREKGLARARALSWDTCASRYQDAIRRLLH